MKNIKNLSVCAISALIASLAFTSCDSEEVMSVENENANERTTFSNTHDIYYQDYLLSQDPDPIYPGWGYERDMGDGEPCDPSEDGECLPEITIIVDSNVQLLSQLIKESNHKDFFVNNKVELSKIFQPTLVNGLIDDFFKLQVIPLKGDKVVKYRFVRKHDNAFVGTYQFSW